MLRLILTTNPFANYCDTWEEPADGWGAPGPHAVQVQTLDHPDVEQDIAVYLPDGDGPVPTIVFVHGWLADSHDRYAFLFERLASNGYAVVFPTYHASWDTSHESRFEQIDAGLALVAEANPRIDTTRVVYAGHSFGGGAVPEVARRGLEQGWGTEGLGLFAMAPWYSYGESYDALPQDTVLVVQTYARDQVVDPEIAELDLWDRVPSTERSWQLVHPRDTEDCRAPAGHLVPGTSGPNTWIRGQRAQRTDAHDVWTVGRRLHALSAYTAGDPQARQVALGVDPADPFIEILDAPATGKGHYAFPWSEREERMR
jgi:dienelactone hydrolase